jgi:hypothetical protein
MNTRQMAHNGQVVGTWDEYRQCWIPEHGKQDELAAQLGDGWTFDDYYGGFFGPPAVEEPKAEADPNMGWVYGFAMPPSLGDAFYTTDREGNLLKLGAVVGVEPPVAFGGEAFRATYDLTGDSDAAKAWMQVFKDAADLMFPSSNLAPANAEASHKSAPAVPGGSECSPSSDRAPNVDDVREFLGSSSEYEHGFLRRKECDALAHEYPAALGWEPYLDPRTMTTYFRRQRG